MGEMGGSAAAHLTRTGTDTAAVPDPARSGTAAAGRWLTAAATPVAQRRDADGSPEFGRLAAAQPG
ncbi:hypothetical protein [Nocardia sp. alder85J]|uniref:hypothetical protein n=1 Tax=Nocardia sp. alder85J TaxID=2862949 RepID=UPI00225A1849|nr:hypothetical protein [Nocardia sp. alder85J]MCX4096869.1 hypothetical protein [Nocardia sp. alder85J]